MPSPSNPNDRIAHSWAELQELLFAQTPDPNGRYRSSYAFRGLSDKSYDLKTSLIQLGGNFEEMESHLLRNFRKYAGPKAVATDSVWNWISLAQHHGLPTRVLDWTYSPYVAMHFATDNVRMFDTDGVIWCVDFIRARTLLPRALKNILAKERSLGFTVDMLSEVCPELPRLRHLGGKKQDFMLFFEPPSIDERIVNQFALFSVLSDPTVPVDQWLRRHKDLYYRVIIPASLKHEVRDKLDQANITERVIFPGLDGLSAWLKRWYSPLRTTGVRTTVQEQRMGKGKGRNGKRKTEDEK